MSLIVEDGSGLSTAESYVSVAAAETYLGLVGDTTFAAKTTAEKEAALRKATQYIDGHYEFKGLKVKREQALQWPRVGVTDESGFEWDSNAVPEKLKQAAAEAALKSISEDINPDVTRPGALLSEQVGAGQGAVTYAATYAGASQVKQYTKVDQLLRDFVDSGHRVRRA